MIKSLSIETMFADAPFYHRFGRARSAGFEWVELSGWTELDFTRVNDELNLHNLRLASIAGSDGHSLVDADRREDFLEFLSQSVAVAKNFDCPNLVIEVGGEGALRPLAGASRDQFAKASAATRTLDEAARKAARAGLTLLIKPVPHGGTRMIGVDTIPSSGDVVKMVNSPALRLLLDVGQARLLPEGVAGTLNLFGNYIGYIHIGDHAGADDPAGLAHVRHMLTAAGYDGVVGFTYRGGSDDPRLGYVREF